MCACVAELCGGYVCVAWGKERERERDCPSNSHVKPSTPISSHGQSLTQHTHLHRGWWDPPWALPCDCSSSTTVCASPLRSYSNTTVTGWEKGVLVQMIYIHLSYIGNLWGANEWYSSLCFPLNFRKICLFCMAIISSGDTSSSLRHYCANHWLARMDVGLKTWIECLVVKNVHPLAVAVMLTQGTVCWEFISMIARVLPIGMFIMYGILMLLISILAFNGAGWQVIWVHIGYKKLKKSLSLSYGVVIK